MDLTEELTLTSEPAELALLGAVARQPDALAGILAALPGSDFHDVARGTVWDACRAMSAAHQPIDPTAVARWLVAHDQWDMHALGGNVRRVVQTDMANHGTNLPAITAAKHADTIAELARRRRLLSATVRARQIVVQHPGDASEALAAVRAALDELDVVTEATGPLGWDALVAEFTDVHSDPDRHRGIPTPWWELDEVLGGLFPGRVYVIGGRPGSGKSTAALVMGMHAATLGKHVLVISKEMPTVDVTGRILARGAEVPLSEINARRVSDISMARIRDYVKRVGRPSITVDARPRSLGGITALARARHHRPGLDVLVVDYVQLVRTDTASRTREQEVAEVSRQLKALSLELGCAVLLPAQLNRGSIQRADTRPMMSDLRDSGQLEQDADAVILLHRPDDDEGKPTGRIHLIVDKNRHGPTSEVSLRWHGGYGGIG